MNANGYREECTGNSRSAALCGGGILEEIMGYIAQGIRDFEKERGLPPAPIPSWRGKPWPDAGILAAYDGAIPGAAERIMDLAERAQRRAQAQGKLKSWTARLRAQAGRMARRAETAGC